MATKKQERALDIVSRLKRMYPKAKCSLDFTNAFELLIATMLSAQSTEGFTPHLQDPESTDPRNLGAMLRFTAVPKKQ